jgi:hypothetical protein
MKRGASRGVGISSASGGLQLDKDDFVADFLRALIRDLAPPISPKHEGDLPDIDEDELDPVKRPVLHPEAVLRRMGTARNNLQTANWRLDWPIEQAVERFADWAGRRGLSRGQGADSHVSAPEVTHEAAAGRQRAQCFPPLREPGCGFPAALCIQSCDAGDVCEWWPRGGFGSQYALGRRIAACSMP